ncbi:hypothetical protein Scep_013149 [Stephania cephalantha]|uniref:Uncharacterized protein n=1 Tax=Stephania cephalantha TaxID=152367 RepID=A0AAP0JHS6_9MAGN
MSKKKAFSGSTMTLKDFHGGSIPSDLPLPSAPGVTVRAPDRSGFDRQIPNAWGNPNFRSRPGSSGANRHFVDEKASLLSNPPHFGRNFDEDERKPLDGVSVPRRTFSDESLQAPVNAGPGGKPAARVVSPVSGPTLQTPSGSAGSYQGRFGGSVPVGAGSQIGGGNVSQGGTNAWGVKKEVVVVGEMVPPPSASHGFSDVSLFARASAVEKVSSGRWQSKQSMQFQSDVEIRRASDFVADFHYKDQGNYVGVDSVSEIAEVDAIKGRYGDRGRISEERVRAAVEELPHSVRERSMTLIEVNENNLPFNYNGHTRTTPAEAKSQTPGHLEVSERPKLKLLPRSRPLETSEPATLEYKQGHQQPVDFVEQHGNANPPKPGSAGSDVIERPKLANLSWSSLPLNITKDNLEFHTLFLYPLRCYLEDEMNTLFGGARPRELVLKDRGVDNVAVEDLSPRQTPNRAKYDHSKNEARQESLVQSARHRERTDSLHLDQRNSRDPERKDHWSNNEKTDAQRNWRNENRRNGKETEKLQQKERPEPESWRKPVEPPKSPQSETPGTRLGKAMSALELAQAFSRSVSEAKTHDDPAQKGTPGRNPIPFSRLTANQDLYSGPTSRHKINGY